MNSNLNLTQSISEIDEEVVKINLEISKLKRIVYDLETEYIGLILKKNKYEEQLRIDRLKKGLLPDGTPE